MNSTSKTAETGERIRQEVINNCKKYRNHFMKKVKNDIQDLSKKQQEVILAEEYKYLTEKFGLQNER